jgi:hypothetical protein
MNVIEAYQNLSEFFNENQIFLLEEDRKKVCPITIDQNRDDASILAALREMEKAGLIRKSEAGGKEYWVLFKSLASYPQTIEISALVCAGIASVINQLCDSLENESEKTDPTNITEKDIKNLIYIASKTNPDALKK